MKFFDTTNFSLQNESKSIKISERASVFVVYLGHAKLINKKQIMC